MYGEGKYCPKGKTLLKFSKDDNGCKNLDELSEIIATSRNYDELTEAWAGWHSIARPMRAKYQRFVELANEGARELGFNDLGEMWRSRYDMPAADFEKEAARLYEQVKPLYQQPALLCARHAAEEVRQGQGAGTASRSPRSCSATCGRSSGTASTTTCSSPTRRPASKPPTASCRRRSGTRCA